MNSPDPQHATLTVAESTHWAAVNDVLEGFEDGTVKEVWLETGRWLTPDDQMAEAGSSTAIVVVQLQSATVRSARLRFRGVRTIEVDLRREVCPSVARDVRDGWEVEFLSCRIAADSCDVELLGDDLLGPGPFLGREAIGSMPQKN